MSNILFYESEFTELLSIEFVDLKSINPEVDTSEGSPILGRASPGVCSDLSSQSVQFWID